MLLAAVLVEGLADRDRDVDADQVEECERAHRIVRAEGHAAVDVLRRHPGLLHQPDGVEEVGEEEAVDEARLVRNLDDGLADRLAPGARPRRDLIACGVRDAELDQLHPTTGLNG